MLKSRKNGLVNGLLWTLLTERQKRIMQLYYDNDWSLGEIAENYEVSRQAIYDVLRRAEKALEQYESRLGLVESLN